LNADCFNFARETREERAATGRKVMSITRRRAMGVIGVAAASPVASTTVRGQTWPSGPVSLVCPYPAGGPNDLLARLVAKSLSESIGGAVIVENRVGAAGNIAAGFVAKARPDGQTLLFTSTGPTANNKFLYPSLPYDPVKDFAAVVLIAKSPVLVTARATAPFSTVAELIAYGKANPGKLNVGTPGIGTVSHIASEYFQVSSGIKMTNVPFPGSTPIINALLGEQIDVAFDLIPTHVPMLKDNRYKAIAITGAKHSASLPSIPTVAESGLPTFEATAWSALMAPVGTPSSAIEKINAGVNAWLKSEDGRAQLGNLDISAEGGTPRELDAFIAAEIAKWGPIIQAAGIKAQ
jgi:tripartite-type tricarboxylate transporter receptor subunit TctC